MASTSDATSTSNYPSGHGAAPFPKDCRACSGAKHMLDSFSKFARLHGRDQQKAKDPANEGMVMHTSTDSAGKDRPSTPSTQTQTPAAASSSHEDDVSGQRPVECPPDTSELGRATWTFLHSMAAYYPEQPTSEQQALMKKMVQGLGEFYPCSICAEHLREQIAGAPPAVESNTALSMWFCRIHNEVNEMLGKPIFDCSKVFERWRDGPADGSCD